jgi:hypothetical protein
MTTGDGGRNGGAGGGIGRGPSGSGGGAAADATVLAEGAGAGGGVIGGEEAAHPATQVPANASRPYLQRFIASPLFGERS